MVIMDFDSLVNKDKYQVFLLSCRPSLPLSFSRHPWFVINKKGVVSRFEIIASPEMYDIQTRFGHLCINALPPWRGLRILRSLRNWGYIWPSVLHHSIEGDEGSLAARVVECIEQSPKEYPYRDRYAYSGPNSNTYAQWVINQFPGSGFKLPWSAFGKSF